MLHLNVVSTFKSTLLRNILTFIYVVTTLLFQSGQNKFNVYSTLKIVLKQIWFNVDKALTCLLGKVGKVPHLIILTILNLVPDTTFSVWFISKGSNRFPLFYCQLVPIFNKIQVQLFIFYLLFSYSIIETFFGVETTWRFQHCLNCDMRPYFIIQRWGRRRAL